MTYALSPGVTVVEKDFTAIVPSVSSSTGAFAGAFPWGPILYPIQLSSETELVAQFGKPSSSNFESFFTAANFLSYTNSLYVTRQDSATGVNAVSNAGTATKIKNIDHYGTLITSTANADWAAKYVGTFGNSLKVSYADSATFKNTISGSISVASAGTALTGGTAFLTELFVGAVIKNASGATVGTVTAITSNSVAAITAAQVALTTATGCLSTWEYYDQFDSAPSTSAYAKSANATNDELHVIVVDEGGVFTGSAGSVLEKFAFVSKALDAKKYDGTNNYYKDAINSSSKYIWWMRHTANVTGTTAWGTVAAGATFKSILTGTSSISSSSSLAGGVDDYTDTNGAYVQAAWLLYLDDSQYDIDLLPIGKATSGTADYVIRKVAEVRKDVVVFVSPQDNSTAAVITGNGSTATDALNAYRNALTSSSFAVLDTGYKYQYDRYNDVYRWVPLNGDIAGLAARTDYTNDAWWSPAGFNRGQIKGVVKLAVNPTKADRDTLYKNGVNPVVSFPGQGTVLYGDKTLLSKPSAFDRIGVRRLFITLEKSISKASEYQLFEFNDAFTRASFKNIVEPFLRDVQGRRGIVDFKVVCDDTNNTSVVIDRNEFIGDIYIKPNRSINYITLNFIATQSGVSFSTVGA